MVWRKLVKSWRCLYSAVVDICDIFCMEGRYNKLVQCGRESTHKRRVASGNSTLGDCTWRDQHLLGEVGEHQWGLGFSCCRLCRAKTVRRCFRACVNMLLTPRFCRRGYFVVANILSTPTFFFTQIFCRRQHFVNASILSTPTLSIFSRRQYFVCV